MILREAVRTLVQMHHVQAHLDVKEIGGGNARMLWLMLGRFTRAPSPPPNICAIAVDTVALARLLEARS